MSENENKYIWVRKYSREGVVYHSWKYVNDHFAHVNKMVHEYASAQDCEEKCIEQWIFDINDSVRFDDCKFENGDNIIACKELVFGDTFGIATWQKFGVAAKAREYLNQKQNVANTILFMESKCLLHWKNPCDREEKN